MNESFNEQELVQYIAERTKADANSVKLVLSHEQAFIGKAQENAKGELEIDEDELVDYVLSRPEVKLDELTVQAILDAETEYLEEKGFAGYAE